MARRSSRARDAQLSTFTAVCDSGLRARLGGKRWTLVSGCEARADRRPLDGVTLIGKQILGWGTWIRTRVARVRAGSFAAKLSPITGWVAVPAVISNYERYSGLSTNQGRLQSATRCCLKTC